MSGYATPSIVIADVDLRPLRLADLVVGLRGERELDRVDQYGRNTVSFGTFRVGLATSSFSSSGVGQAVAAKLADPVRDPGPRDVGVDPSMST